MGIWSVFATAVFGMVLVLQSGDASAQVLTPAIETPQGPIQGEATRDGMVWAFRGIPYAQPPVGVRRWKDAQPASDWTNLRAATLFSPSCVQVEMPQMTALPGGQEQQTFFWQPDGLASEDCLYLNIWSPAQNQGKSLPVMFWIHGGGLIQGGASLPIYDGEALARKDVVVVTFNYRLGVFGFFAHPELSAESPTNTSGNYGLSDMLEALRWVKRSIAAYGGDPNNVTIFGESAGSWSVSMLMATQLSDGLFHKAIGQSGAAFNPMLKLRETSLGRLSAEDAGLNFSRVAVDGGGLASLRDLSAADLHSKAMAAGIVIPGELAIVDGQMLTQSVRDVFDAGLQKRVPVIVGFNSDEGSGLSDYYSVPTPPATPDAYTAAVKANFDPFTDEFLRAYPATDPVAAVFDAYRDAEYGSRMEAWASSMFTVGKPAYLYYFSKTPPGGDRVRGMPNSTATRRVGAHHAAEIPYIFGSLDRNTMSSDPPTEKDRKLSDTISDYWVSFATTGDPNGEGRPVWTPYLSSDRHFIEFGETVRPGKDLLPGRLELHTAMDAERLRRGIPWNGSGSGFGVSLNIAEAEER